MVGLGLLRVVQLGLIGLGVGCAVSGFVALAVQANGVWQPALPRTLSWQGWHWSAWTGVSLLGAALLAGQILQRLDQGRPRGPADLIHATLRDADPEFRQGLLSSLLALGNVAGGASVGLFGPSVHLGGWLGAWIRRRFERFGLRAGLGRDVVMAAGLSAAVSALFLAPFGGMLFGMEIILRRLSVVGTLAVAIAAGLAFGVARAMFGGAPLLAGHGQVSLSAPALALALGVGLAAGLVAAAYIWAATHMPGLARASQIPLAMRPLVPAALLFALSPLLPLLLGPGFTTLPLALAGELSLGLVIALLIGKLLVTPLCLGFGFAGGVVGPALFLGAMLGGLAGPLGGNALLGVADGDASLGLMAAAGCAAAVTGAPLASLVLMFELTGSAGFMLPGLVVVAIATRISAKLVGRSLFERQLALRGVPVGTS